MPNRRSVLLGMGVLTIGGGAAMGSGAFTSGETTLTRGVEVNVIAEENVPQDAVDIILDIGTHTSELKVADTLTTSGPTTSYLDETALFPTRSDDASYDNYTPADGDVSLVSNDVGIVFGRNDGSGSLMLPNATTIYNNLITITTNSTDTFDVSFDLAGTQDFSIEIEGTDIVSSTYTASGITDQTRNLTLSVLTRDNNKSSVSSQIDDLTITITTP